MPAAPHIARLRAKVGNDLLLLPSVAVLPIDDDDRVLLVRQTDFGSYGTIGGAVDEDEAPEDAARREAREEIGAEVELTGLVSSASPTPTATSAPTSASSTARAWLPK